MEFEWDENNSNIKKHGISFEEAKGVFDDANSYTEQSSRKNETRFKKTGLISARKANKKEKEIYHERTN